MKTKEIFSYSMVLSDAAYKEKGEALKKYQEWLDREWDPRGWKLEEEKNET